MGALPLDDDARTYDIGQFNNNRQILFLPALSPGLAVAEISKAKIERLISFHSINAPFFHAQQSFYLQHHSSIINDTTSVQQSRQPVSTLYNKPTPNPRTNTHGRHLSFFASQLYTIRHKKNGKPRG